MLKFYIIGSNKFDEIKGYINKILNNLEGVHSLAVGYSIVYQDLLLSHNYDELHKLENISIEQSDIILLVDKDPRNNSLEKYVGDDTQRELSYAKSLGKTIWTVEQLFDNFTKIKGLQ